MDTCHEVTLFGHKLTQLETTQLANKLVWGWADNGDGSLEVYPDTPPVSGYESKDGDYKGCRILDVFLLAEGVFFIPVGEEYYVGDVIRAKASRWHEGDCGTYTNENLPNQKSIEDFLRANDLESSAKVHEVLDNPC